MSGKRGYMNEKCFSKKYAVRKLQKKDIPFILGLCSKNTLYYEYCPPFVSYESIEEDMNAIPPNVETECKYYIGFYDENKLLAVLDLIDGYPDRNHVFIGFFMCEVSIQNCGVGTEIITELLDTIKEYGYKSVQLAWAKGNPQAEHFWMKNGFKIIKETASTASECVILAERDL